jgi:hypothetical protein
MVCTIASHAAMNRNYSNNINALQTLRRLYGNFGAVAGSVLSAMIARRQDYGNETGSPTRRGR